MVTLNGFNFATINIYRKIWNTFTNKLFFDTTKSFCLFLGQLFGTLLKQCTRFWSFGIVWLRDRVVTKCYFMPWDDASQKMGLISRLSIKYHLSATKAKEKHLNWVVCHSFMNVCSFYCHLEPIFCLYCKSLFLFFKFDSLGLYLL